MPTLEGNILRIKNKAQVIKCVTLAPLNWNKHLLSKFLKGIELRRKLITTKHHCEKFIIIQFSVLIDVSLSEEFFSLCGRQA